MFSVEDIIKYHCPRWNEMPDIELYMDQVLIFIEKNIALFAGDESGRPMTKTMINNYVKQKKIAPPRNKRYNRSHLAYFMVVGILKRFMSLSEISDGIKAVRSKHLPEEAYNLFCEGFENSLRLIFTGNNVCAAAEKQDEIALIGAVTAAYANMLYARYLIFNNICGGAGARSDGASRHEKKTGK